MADFWYSAAEIALMKLPGLPSSKVNILATASRQSWPSRPREGRGGGREYPVSALPTKAQRAIAKRAIRNLPVPAPYVPEPDGLKTCQRLPMQARSIILNHIDSAVLQGVTKAKAIEAFLEDVRTGQLSPFMQATVTAANARAGTSGRTISRATLFGWIAKQKNADGKRVALAPAIPKEGEIPDWAGTFMRLYSRPSSPNIPEILDSKSWPKNEFKPSADQCRRFLKKMDAISRNAGRMGPRAIKQLQAYKTRDVSDLWPGAVFIGDGHTDKREVAHPVSGKPFRPEITAILDVYTKKWVGWSVALAENTWSVADALRHAVTTTTCPAIFYYDNGAGANNRFWDDDAAGIIARLTITKLNSAPWSSQARGIIERFNSTVLHRRARSVPTYVGQRMDDEARQHAYRITRRDIAAIGTSPLLMSWQDYIADLTEAQAEYNARPHSSLPKIIDLDSGKRRHATPDEFWNMSIDAGWTPDPVPAAEARELFRPAVNRTTSRGMLKLFNNAYFAQELVALDREQVVVAFDIHDPSTVRVSLADGRVICDATLNGNTTPYIPVSFADQAEQKRLQGKLKRLDFHRDVALAEAGPRLIEQRMQPPISLEDQLARDQFEAEFADAVPAQIIEIETRVTRFSRALDIERRLLADDGEVAGGEAKWLARYQLTPEYRAAKDTQEDFGLDAIAE